MNYTVYCDESRHTGGVDCKFSVIGGIWVPRDFRDDINKELKEIKNNSGIVSELKWSKVSELKLDSYKKIIDYFWNNKNLFYRSIIVDQDSVDYDNFHNGDRELGFYKFYYEMIVKWLFPGNDYNLLLDFKNNSNKSRLPALRTVLENYGRQKNISISNLTCIDSKQSNILQLCDILTGAISADSNGVRTNTPKFNLINHISHLRGISPLSSRSISADFCKFNVFRIVLGARH